MQIETLIKTHTWKENQNYLWFVKLLSVLLPFHLLVGGGTEEVHSGAGLRTALEHKGFSQGSIRTHLSPLQLHC